MSRDRNHWTAAEYLEWARTGKEPSENPLPKNPDDRERKIMSGVGDLCAETRALMEDVKQKKRSKYGNTRVTVDGITFDSKHEAQVYQELMMRVRAGELRCVCRQVKFDLGGGAHAEKESRYTYIADFVTIDRNGVAEVLDAKSEATRKNRVYINKKKQMKSEWGIEIREV